MLIGEARQGTGCSRPNMRRRMRRKVIFGGISSRRRRRGGKSWRSRGKRQQRSTAGGKTLCRVAASAMNATRSYASSTFRLLSSSIRRTCGTAAFRSTTPPPRTTASQFPTAACECARSSPTAAAERLSSSRGDPSGLRHRGGSRSAPIHRRHHLYRHMQRRRGQCLSRRASALLLQTSRGRRPYHFPCLTTATLHRTAAVTTLALAQLAPRRKNATL
mmetsp:Transcript_57320/g.134636  ORF Transcript_57320/g.134636 Transcript_57320/m.134636 type:complete len:218 (-) Transcript_57320:133-786(-)